MLLNSTWVMRRVLQHVSSTPNILNISLHSIFISSEYWTIVGSINSFEAKYFLYSSNLSALNRSYISPRLRPQKHTIYGYICLLLYIYNHIFNCKFKQSVFSPSSFSKRVYHRFFSPSSFSKRTYGEICCQLVADDANKTT